MNAAPTSHITNYTAHIHHLTFEGVV